jgi:hypothetical protein
MAAHYTQFAQRQTETLLRFAALAQAAIMISNALRPHKDFP